MKKIILILVILFGFSGCSKFDGVVTAVGVANEFNPDIKSKSALKAYGTIRKEVRIAQELKKQDANTSKVSEN